MGGKKKNKKGKKEPNADDTANNEIEEERKRLKLEADAIWKNSLKEENAANEYQQQREKLIFFWIVERKNLEDTKAELRNKEREIQDLEEKQQVEIKIYKQRVKHLLFEHQHETAKNKAEAEIALKLSQDDHRAAESELKSDRRSVKLTLKEMELSHDDYIQTIEYL